MRKNLYAVKIRCGDTGVDGWVVERICRSIDTAQRYQNQRKPSSGYFLRSKIVHPSQRVVDVWVVCGNQIEE